MPMQGVKGNARCEGRCQVWRPMPGVKGDARSPCKLCFRHRCASEPTQYHRFSARQLDPLQIWLKPTAVRGKWLTFSEGQMIDILWVVNDWHCGKGKMIDIQWGAYYWHSIPLQWGANYWHSNPLQWGALLTFKPTAIRGKWWTFKPHSIEWH